MKKYLILTRFPYFMQILFILIIFASCTYRHSNAGKEDNIYCVDSSKITPRVKKILSEYMAEFPQFENLLLDNAIPIRMELPDKEANHYYYLSPTYISEQIGEEQTCLSPPISFAFNGRRIFLRSNVDNMVNPKAVERFYYKHLEFEGIQNHIDKYFWLICIPNNQQAYIVTKNIEENEIPNTKEIQHFKASENKISSKE